MCRRLSNLRVRRAHRDAQCNVIEQAAWPCRRSRLRPCTSNRLSDQIVGWQLRGWSAWGPNGLEAEDLLYFPRSCQGRHEVRTRRALPAVHVEPGAGRQIEDLVTRITASEGRLRRVEQGPLVEPTPAWPQQ